MADVVVQTEVSAGTEKTESEVFVVVVVVAAAVAVAAELVVLGMKKMKKRLSLEGLE